MFMEIIENGIEAEKASSLNFFDLAERFRKGQRSTRSKAVGGSNGPDGFRRLMPKIEIWDNFRQAACRHPTDRMRDRAITVGDLNQLRLLIVPEPGATRGGLLQGLRHIQDLRTRIAPENLPASRHKRQRVRPFKRIASSSRPTGGDWSRLPIADTDVSHPKQRHYQESHRRKNDENQQRVA